MIRTYDPLQARINFVFLSSCVDVILQHKDDSQNRETHFGFEQINIKKEALHKVSPLHIAVFQGDLQVVEMLLGRGANPALVCDFNNHSTSGVQGSSKCGVDVKGFNALQLAIFLRDTAAVSTILRCAALPKALIEAKWESLSHRQSKFGPDTGYSSGSTYLAGDSLHLALLCSSRGLSPAPSRGKIKPRSDAESNEGKRDCFEILLEYLPTLDQTMQSYEAKHTDDGCFHCNTSRSLYETLTPLHLAGILHLIEHARRLLKVRVVFLLRDSASKPISITREALIPTWHLKRNTTAPTHAELVVWMMTKKGSQRNLWCPIETSPSYTTASSTTPAR